MFHQLAAVSYIKKNIIPFRFINKTWFLIRPVFAINSYFLISDVPRVTPKMLWNEVTPGSPVEGVRYSAM